MYCCWERLLFWGPAVFLEEEIPWIKIAFWILLQIKWEGDALAKYRYGVAGCTNSAGRFIWVQLSNPKLNRLLVFSIWTTNFSSGDMHLRLITLKAIGKVLALLLPSVSVFKVWLCLSPGVCRLQIWSRCAKLMWRQMKYRSQQPSSYLKGDRASPWQARGGDSISVWSTSSSKPKDLQYCHSLLPLSLVDHLFHRNDEICICHHKKFVGVFLPHKKD